MTVIPAYFSNILCTGGIVLHAVFPKIPRRKLLSEGENDNDKDKDEEHEKPEDDGAANIEGAAHCHPHCRGVVERQSGVHPDNR